MANFHFAQSSLRPLFARRPTTATRFSPPPRAQTSPATSTCAALIPLFVTHSAGEGGVTHVRVCVFPPPSPRSSFRNTHISWRPFPLPWLPRLHPPPLPPTPPSSRSASSCSSCVRHLSCVSQVWARMKREAKTKLDQSHFELLGIGPRATAAEVSVCSAVAPWCHAEGKGGGAVDRGMAEVFFYFSSPRVLVEGKAFRERA